MIENEIRQLAINHCKENDTTVSSLAHRIGVQPAVLIKIISGERFPFRVVPKLLSVMGYKLEIVNDTGD